ncbi:MAG: magnesium transporter [Campylobacterota bacterium]|nr:magnesium transporter [Campylobacterota bacterium]
MKDNIFKSDLIIKDIKNEIKKYKSDKTTIHPYDFVELLLDLRELSKEKYLKILKKIPHKLFADILAEMPPYIQEEIAEIFGNKKVADIASKMDTDDTADFIQNVSEENEKVANDILDNFKDDEKKVISQLISYNEDEAGAYMQTEIFSVNISENIGSSLKRLKKLKDNDKIDNIWHAHIIDNNSKYLGSVGLEELILFEHHLYYSDIPKDKFLTYCVNHKSNIKDVIEMVTNYNLNIIAVLNENNQLIGRITSDDIYDIIEESATEQIYNLAGVDDDAEQEERIFEIGKTRAVWLSINLFTAILASFIIGLFDETIHSLVALAVLMPIVASMGGNAGTQTLTVTVRQMALGDIEGEDAKKTIIKEVIISLANGILFAIIIGVISYFWFNIPLLGVVIAISIVINLLSAGFFGSIIPLLLQKLKIDPAIGSTVLLTTITDIVGFFSFLGLATIILL